MSVVQLYEALKRVDVQKGYMSVRHWFYLLLIVCVYIRVLI